MLTDQDQLPVFLLLFGSYQFFSCATGRRGDGEWDGSDGSGVRRHARTERSSAATVEREGRCQLQTHVRGTTSLTCYDQDRYPNDIVTSLSHFSWPWCSMVWTFMWLVSEVLHPVGTFYELITRYDIQTGLLLSYAYWIVTPDIFIPHPYTVITLLSFHHCSSQLSQYLSVPNHAHTCVLNKSKVKQRLSPHYAAANREPDFLAHANLE